MTLVATSLGLAPEDYFRAPGAQEDKDSDSPATVADVYVAPSIMRGREKYTRMLNKDSITQAWKVALKTDRRARLMYEDRLPAGFPLLYEFFTKAKSLRVFEIGFETYRSLYEDPSFWVQWHYDVENIAQWHVQTLRNAIITAFTPSLNEGKLLTKTQLSILRFTVREGMWPVELAASFPKRLRVETRWGVLRWACRVRKYGKAWAEYHSEVSRPWDAGEAVEVGSVAFSPSLKRKREA